MRYSHRQAFGGFAGRWLITLNIDRVERASVTAKPAGPDSIDWDALADQYSVPVSPDADGLQLCARCRRSVAPASEKFAGRVRLGSFLARIAAGVPWPAGAYLCGDCSDPILECPVVGLIPAPDLHRSPKETHMTRTVSPRPMMTFVYDCLRRSGLAETFNSSTDFHLRLDNPPYLPLVLERHGAEVSLAHYFTQNGDAMRDPELTFDFQTWLPTSITQDPVAHYAAVDEWPKGSSRRAHLTRELLSFAAMWARNLQEQGFAGEAVKISSLTHPSALERTPVHHEPVDTAPDEHLERQYEDRSADDYNDYEPSPYDGTYSEE